MAKYCGFLSTSEIDTQKDACLVIVNAKRFLLCCVWGAGVSRDVVLRMRSNGNLVRASERGIEPGGYLACAARETSAGADDRPQSKLEADDAVPCRSPAAVCRRTATMTAAPGLSQSQHQPQQSGRQCRRPHRLVAFARGVDRARAADACAARARTAGLPARLPTGSAFTANSASRSAVPLRVKGFVFPRG